MNKNGTKLDQYCHISSGGTPSRRKESFYGGDILWSTIADMEKSDGVVVDTKEKITPEGLASIGNRIFVKNTLLLAMYGSVGKVAITGKEMATNQAILGINPKNEDEIYIPYLRYWLMVNKKKIVNKARGGILKNLSAKIVKNLKIDLPSYDKQIKIANLLTQVETLISKREESIELLDELIKSTFLDMFIFNNNKDSWKVDTLFDLSKQEKGSMRTGPFGSNLLHDEFTEEGDVAVLGIDNAVQNKFVWAKKRFITYEKYQELKNYTIHPEDVIITIMGTVGRSAVVPRNIPHAINTKHLAAISLDQNIANPYFIAYSIHSNPEILSQIKNKTRGAIMAGFNLGLIKKLKLS